MCFNLFGQTVIVEFYSFLCGFVYLVKGTSHNSCRTRRASAYGSPADHATKYHVIQFASGDGAMATKEIHSVSPISTTVRFLHGYYSFSCFKCSTQLVSDVSELCFFVVMYYRNNFETRLRHW